MKIDWAKLDKDIIGLMGILIAVCIGLALVCGAGWLLVFAGKAFLTILEVKL